MTDDYLKRTRTQVRNGWGVETKPEHLADVFAAYNQTERANILNEWDSSREDGFGSDTQRGQADNMMLRFRLEAMHQTLMKANR